MTRRDFLATSVSGAVSAALMAAQVRARADEPRFKKAVCAGMLPGNLPLEARFRLAAKVGFQGVEAPPLGTEEERIAWRDAAKQAGIELHSVIYGGWHAPLSSPDPAKIEAGLQGLEGALRTAKTIGATTVLLVPAVVNDEATVDQAWKRSQEHIRTLIPLAQELNVVIAIEEVWNNFLLDDPAAFARYVDEFGSPCVQAYFDIANVVKYGRPEDWIHTLGKRIVKVHIKDYKKNPEGWPNLRDGDVNWLAVRQALLDVGYHGYLTAELAGGDEAYLKDVSSRIDLIVAGQ